MLCFLQILLFTLISESVDDFNLNLGLKSPLVGGLCFQTKMHWKNFKSVFLPWLKNMNSRHMPVSILNGYVYYAFFIF